MRFLKNRFCKVWVQCAHRKRKDRDRSHVEDNLNKYMKLSPTSRKHYDSSRQVKLVTERIQAFLSYHHCTFQIYSCLLSGANYAMRVNGLLTFACNTAHFSKSLSERYRDVGLYMTGSFYWIILQVFSWHCLAPFASNLSTVYSCVLTLSRVIKQYDIFILLPYRP